MKWGQPRTGVMVFAFLFAAPAFSRADTEEVRQVIGGALTALPATAGLGMNLAGLAMPDRGVWLSGLALAGLGPTIGHLVNRRYGASLALLGVKSAAIGIMYETAARDDFLDPERPVNPQFWVGWVMFGLAAGAEVYLGADDIREAMDWSISPFVVRGGGGLSARWSLGGPPIP